jgi:hypothetical protein
LENQKPHKIVPNKNKINVASLVEIDEAHLHFVLKNKAIFDRVYYIYKCIAKEFKVRLLPWKMESYEIKDFHFDVEDPVWDWMDNPLAKSSSSKAYLNEGEWDFSDGEFPSRWIFSDFEKELSDGKKAYEDMLLKEAEEEKRINDQKRNASKNRAKIMASIKKKLTEEELEVFFG